MTKTTNIRRVEIEYKTSLRGWYVRLFFKRGAQHYIPVCFPDYRAAAVFVNDGLDAYMALQPAPYRHFGYSRLPE
jgi:hypothetical protein